MSMQQQIEAKLAAALAPTHLEVINESYMHRVAPGSESHFKVVVVSQAFEGQRLLGRHRQVNGVLAEEPSGRPGKRPPRRRGVSANPPSPEPATGRLCARLTILSRACRPLAWLFSRGRRRGWIIFSNPCSQQV